MVAPTPQGMQGLYPPPPCLPIGVYISHGPQLQRHTQTIKIRVQGVQSAGQKCGIPQTHAD
eukprot:3858555-Karenia_brevis.AAC.1